MGRAANRRSNFVGFHCNFPPGPCKNRLGIEIALFLEAIVYELNTSLNAANMIKRLGKI